MIKSFLIVMCIIVIVFIVFIVLYIKRKISDAIIESEIDEIKIPDDEESE